MPERWTWRVAELPYEYAVEIRGEQVVWIWDSGPGIPPTEEAQPLRALLQQGRAAVPSAWQQVPPPILEQVRARGAQLLGGAGADGVEATGPTQFAPAIAAQTAMSSPAPGAAPGQASSNPQGSAGANPQGNAAPPGWG
ncbi:MAG: hypothetical protein KC766_15625, partial [Myxococcales bacterium]|nr:hypothetical protein [Myxococcales bacterium]